MMTKRLGITRGRWVFGLGLASLLVGAGHDNIPEKLAAYAKLNHYHVDTLAYYIKKLDSIQDGDGTCWITRRCSTAAA